MSGIKFYSEHDMTCGLEIQKIVEKIKNEVIDIEWSITDLLEFNNILKFISVKGFSDYIVKETSIDIKNYEKKIKEKIGKFVGCHKDVFINLYNEIDVNVAEDFSEVIEDYKLYKRIETENFKRFLEKENVHIFTVLKFKGLTEHFNEAVKDILLSDSRNIEKILSKYLKEKDLYLPSTLSEKEILRLIDEYIDAPIVNINTLRKIINFPTNKGLSIPDKMKLHAKRKAKEEEVIFNNGTGLETGVMISYPPKQDEAILFTNGRTVDIKISRNWIEENIDYPTLWNNFIYLFEFVDEKMRLALDSKKSEISALESLYRNQAEHLYCQSFSFYHKEMISNAELYSYATVLNILGVRVEEMIKWFFYVYVKE